MKKTGWILILISAAVIFYNVVIVKNYDEHQLNDHPFATFFSGGENLKHGYTFTPPYTGFEIFILAMGIGGIVLVVIESNRSSKP
jgi:hypothetical protein